MNLHLTGVGTLSGDMFIAAALDAFPGFEARVLEAIDALDAPYPVVCSLEPHLGRENGGWRFDIQPFNRYFGHIPYAFTNESANSQAVHEWMDAAALDSRVRTHAQNILEAAARIESRRQHVAHQRVVFEEVASWKSTAQVVGAAALIEALDSARWTCALSAGVHADLITLAILDYLSAGDTWRRNPRQSASRCGAGYGAVDNSVLRLWVFAQGDEAFEGPFETRERAMRAGIRARDSQSMGR